MSDDVCFRKVKGAMWRNSVFARRRVEIAQQFDRGTFGRFEQAEGLTRPRGLEDPVAGFVSGLSVFFGPAADKPESLRRDRANVMVNGLI